jgi:dGTP triphosphohydrolase
LGKKEIKKIQKEIININKGVTMAFQKVAEEFSEHLDTINANTSETAALTQAIYVLEEKIDKLNERIDEFTVSKSFKRKDFSNIEINLNVQEQEVFATLYTSEKFLSIKQISGLVGRTIDATKIILKRLVSKKISILKETNGKEYFYGLDKFFKQIQAKENIVKLNETVLRELRSN